VLNASTDYTPIAVSPVDAALVDMKRLSLLDVANAFGVPGYMLGAEGPSMTYSNVAMEAANLYEFTLRPWAVAIEETLSALLPGGQTVDIRVEGGAVNGTGVAAAAGVDVPVADVPAG
jgi:HK97 family phage portal protein